MARMDELDLPERLFLKGYPFKRFAPRPNDPVTTTMTPLRKPLAECTVALATTAGLSLPGQPPFDKTIKMGDSSFVGPAKLIKASAPEVARRLVADSVDVVLLTPF